MRRALRLAGECVLAGALLIGVIALRNAFVPHLPGEIWELRFANEVHYLDEVVTPRGTVLRVPTRQPGPHTSALFGADGLSRLPEDSVGGVVGIWGGDPINRRTIWHSVPTRRWLVLGPGPRCRLPAATEFCGIYDRVGSTRIGPPHTKTPEGAHWVLYRRRW